MSKSRKPASGSRVTHWGYTFVITDDHLTLETSHHLKFSCDTLADAALKSINAIRSEKKIDVPVLRDAELGTPDNGQSAGLAPVRDLYVLLEQNHANEETLHKLWNQIHTVPDWVDWAQIARGQKVFYRYAGPCIVGLAFQSLLGGMGASRVVEVLARTGGFSTKVARKRLFETAQHVLQCTSSLESIQPGGDGFKSSVKVRLLHATVRQRILKLAATHPEYYDVDRFGIPINDLDCIATIGTFSATLIWLALPRQGIFLRQQEIEDFTALYRYVGYLTGTPDEYFATPQRAKTVMESLLMNEVAPTATSKILASNILSSLQDRPPGYSSRQFLEANSRWLNGNELCDALGIGRPGLYYWMLAAGQAMFFMFTCYLSRTFPSLDRRKIATSKIVLWRLIVEGKDGLGGMASFDFTHIPAIGKDTELDSGSDVRLKPAGTERRNLRAFALGVLFTTASAGLLLRTFFSIVANVRSIAYKPQIFN